MLTQTFDVRCCIDIHCCSACTILIDQGIIGDVLLGRLKASDKSSGVLFSHSKQLVYHGSAVQLLYFRILMHDLTISPIYSNS